MKAPPRSPLERRLRRASRLALYTSMGLVGLLVALGALYLRTLAPSSRDALPGLGVDYSGLVEVRLLQRYLQVDTAQPDADELAGARFLAEVLAEHGIESEIEVLGERHANLVAILEGESPQALVLHSHIDTDPVDPSEQWIYPPFSGHIESPYIYGRGAFDMKSIAVAQLAAFLDLKARGKPLKRSVIFLATGSEEVGSDLGTKWVLARHPELARRFWGFLTEGGVVETTSAADVKFWGIEVSQKRYVDVVLCSGSRQRLEELRQELLEERQEGNFAVEMRPEVEAFLEHYIPTRVNQSFRDALERRHTLRLDAPRYFELPVYLRAMFRDEALPFRVTELPDGGFELLVKFHLLPGSDFEAAFERFLPQWRIAGLDFAVHDEGGATHGSPIDHELYRAMVGSLLEAHPGVVVGPHFLPWTATDARFARAGGIPAYGFSPFLIFTTETGRIGRENERMLLKAFVDGVEIYRKLVRRLVE